MNEAVFLAILLGTALVVAAAAVPYLVTAFRRRPTAADKTEVLSPDFSESAGFRVIHLPDDPIITLQSSWLLHGRIGELIFGIEPRWTAVLRIGRAGSDLETAELMQNYEQRETLKLQGISVQFFQSPGRAALLLWRREGFDYALYYPETERGLASGLADDFVLGVVTESAAA